LSSEVVDVTLKRGEDRRIRSGHLWVFSNEIEKVAGPTAPGDCVNVLDARGRFLGTGYINSNSLIAVRIVSRSNIPLSREFFAARIESARGLRERLWPGERSYRAVHGEGDLLPGLIVDRYEDCLVVQSLAAGIERRLSDIIDALDEVFSPASIVLRNDAPMRKREGLALETRVVKGDVAQPIVIEQDTHRFRVDVLEGQKTGFFLDQRENRRTTADLARDQDVLDCCCYTGAWSVYAGACGARSVTSIDSSRPALEAARANAELNGLSALVSLRRGDVFGKLSGMGRRRREFGLVIVDPPSFARSRKHVRDALKAYRTLNRLALSVTGTGGHLVTCSCSHLVTGEAFAKCLAAAAKDAGRQARIVGVNSQSRDHPVLLGLPETEYLKCVVLEVM
jgi:23S rRNA (cytosine1962-C5)-methyltransferase